MDSVVQRSRIEILKKHLYRPSEASHKGENGRLLVVGGSNLFHASIFWSADMASRVVDLVHFSSPAEENNNLVRKKLKEGFWNGIVVPFSRVREYIEEDDVILIGPGMARNEGLVEGEASTGVIVNELVAQFPHKRWVIDGGALQEIDPHLLGENMIITPHHKEWQRITQETNLVPQSLHEQIEAVREFSNRHNNVTVVLKGKEDIVGSGDEVVVVEGGNPGMTKGGTGDVLAGLVAALYCKNNPMVASQIASMVMKQAGDELYKRVKVYFNASDLLEEVPKVLGRYQ